jgi:hypothetical protein
MPTHKNLLTTINALESLESGHASAWQPSNYSNRRRVWGMCVGFWHGRHHHTISVHNCQRTLSAAELAHLIGGIELIDEHRFGIYGSRKNAPGFYATAQSTRTFDGSFNHWYMIGYSCEWDFAEILGQKKCLSAEEEDLLRYLNSVDSRSRICA